MYSLGPGPAYSLPPTIGYDKHDQSKYRSPQYSMAGRLKIKNVNITQGPIVNTQGLTRYGRPTSYAYSIASRTFVNDSKKVGPGPAHYDLSKKPYVSMTAPPSYSLGRGNNFSFKNQIPGPNAYAVNYDMIKKYSPAYSIGIKTEFKNKRASPGPANYTASNFNITMPKAPEYSILGRSNVYNKLFVPGADLYDRRNYKPGKSSPSYSFGIRHSSKAPPLIVACDNL